MSVAAAVIDNFTVLLVSSVANNVPALNFVLLVVIAPFVAPPSLSEFVTIVPVNAPPTLSFTNDVIAVSLNTFTVLFFAVIVFSAFCVVIVFVALASFTVVVLSNVAVITELPVPFTAFNVAPFVPEHVITFVVPELNFTAVFAVPPSPAIEASVVVSVLYVSLSDVGFVNVNVLVYFSTVNVTSTLFAA